MRLPHCFYLLLLAFVQLNCGETKREPAAQMHTATNSPARPDSTILENAPEPTTTQALPAPDTTDFTKAFANFQLAILNQDSVAFQQFIDPKRNVFIIEVPGAVPHFMQVKYISRFKRSFQQKPFFSIRQELTPCQLASGLPPFSCDPEKYGTKSGYAKEGCFYGKPDTFRKSKMWEYADLTQTHRQQIEATLPLLSQTVIHTASSYKFHFGFVNGHWRIYFIDLSVPCSA